MNRMTRLARRLRRDERAVEAPAMLIVLPVLVVLIMALIDVGMMMRTRMLVENIARDTARQVAADGGIYNPRTNTNARDWQQMAADSLFRDGACTLSRCNRERVPEVTCTYTRPDGSGYGGNAVERAGDLVTCNVYYPYRPINGALLNGPIGLGFGSMLQEFTVGATARAETGTQG